MEAILRFLENLGRWVVSTFHADDFVNSLQYMGKGMAGILIVTAVIKFFKNHNKDVLFSVTFIYTHLNNIPNER